LQYKNAAFRFACCHPNEDGIPSPEEATQLDPEEWWGSVSDALDRAEKGRKTNPQPCECCREEMERLRSEIVSLHGFQGTIEKIVRLVPGWCPENPGEVFQWVSEVLEERDRYRSLLRHTPHRGTTLEAHIEAFRTQFLRPCEEERDRAIADLCTAHHEIGTLKARLGRVETERDEYAAKIEHQQKVQWVQRWNWTPEIQQKLDMLDKLVERVEALENAIVLNGLVSWGEEES